METKEIVTYLLDRVVRHSIDLDRSDAERRELLFEKETRVGARPLDPEGDAIVLIRAMASEQKIEAIKAYRSLTGHGLKESKDAIETVMNKMRHA